MEIPKEINISEITRKVMRPIDLSVDVYYSALVNGESVMYATDGFFKPHITITEWAQKVVLIYIERYNQFYEMNK